MFILFAERKVGEQHGPAAQGVLAAVQTLREMNADNLRKVPADAPTAFIKPRWKPLVITPEGLDRKFYEICALSELKNALRSGDIWVKGSRQFRDFDDYLLPAEKFAALKREQALPLAINPNSDQYLEERLQLLDEQLATVTRLAKDNELPDAILTESGLKITPLDAAVPDRAQALIDQTSQLLPRMPRIKITETSTTTCCRPRSSPHSSASRPCPWRSTRTATSTWKSVCSCWTSSWPPSPAWPRTTSCPMPSSPSQG